MRQRLGRVLVIAGSDSGGGAGLQADVKTITVHGGHAATAVTAVTVQDTLGVRNVFPVPAEIVLAQGRAVLDDIGTDAVKVGMLGDIALVEAAAELIDLASGAPAVIDPVMSAKGGASLLAQSALERLKAELVPRAALLTPNAPEAEALTGLPVRTPEDLLRAGEVLLRLGAQAVLMKGGHVPGESVVDLLLTSKGETRFEAARIDSRHTHGTGCTLASAIAAQLAQGLPLETAVERARDYVRGAILNAPGFGAGHGPLDHGWAIRDQAPRASAGHRARDRAGGRRRRSGAVEMRQWTVDAFADRPFRGNPACVVEPFEAWPDDGWMQALAEENRQAETAFLRHTADPDRFELRWFTPALEVPLCGHATLASAHVLFGELELAAKAVRFETRRSGVLSVARAERGYRMDFPALPATPIGAPPGLAEALGAEPVQVFASRYLLAIVADEASVRALRPDLAAVERISKGAAERGNVVVSAPADPDRPYRVVSRFFAPGSGIPEDPATGSAHCILAPVWAAKLGRLEMDFHQAYPGRGADLHCEVAGERVLIGGEAVTLMESRLRLQP